MSHDLSRRDFHELALAALAGVLSGSLAGCPSAPPAAGTGAETPAASHDLALMLDEPHVCRGLNTCKNKGKSLENACAGQGTCSTVAAHGCSGQNKCKGEGGCGGFPGANTCQGKGHCSVPLQHAWDAARKNFESAMKDAGKEFGAAPAPSA